MWWFQREDCGEFYSKLCADVNEASSNEWKVSNYHNDACGSVCFYLDSDTETYVQLFAFMTKEDADLEGLEMFAITYSLNGETDYDTWYGDSRDEACQRAAYFANKLREEYREAQARDLIEMPITDDEEAKEFTFALAKAGLMFHFDDEAEDCLREYNFPKEVTDGIQSQVNKLCKVLDDPFEYAIDAFHAVDPEGEKDIDEMVNVPQDDGFEHEGMWVTDRTKSPCGRFDLTPEQSREIYGDK